MQVSLKELKTLREQGRTIVLATGTFDLFHWEHLRYLEDAAKLGDILVVAIKDNRCARFKGENRPIIDEIQRMDIVDALRCVDYTILANYDDSFEGTVEYANEAQRLWLNMFGSIFENLRPDILYYEENYVLQSARDEVFKKYGITGVARPRTAVVSTSKIVDKINKRT